jgi:hypothetical protein
MGVVAAASLHQQKRKRLLDVDGSKAPDKRIWRLGSKVITPTTPITNENHRHTELFHDVDIQGCSPLGKRVRRGTVF